MKHKTLLLLAVFVAAAAIGLALRAAHHRPVVPGLARLPAQRPLADKERQLLGSVQAGQVVTLAAPASGKVVGMMVSPGSLVRRDQVLLYISSQAIRKDLEAAQSAFRKAQTQVPLPTDKLHRKPSHAPPSPQALGTAQKQAVTQLQEAQARADAGTVRSPRAGRVSELLAQVGGTVHEGETLAVIEPMEGAKLVFRTSRADAPRMTRGQAVQVRLPDGQELPGQVLKIEMRPQDAEVVVEVAAGTPLPPPGTPLTARLTLSGR
jgi:biotin carboxyl carrier protein